MLGIVAWTLFDGREAARRQAEQQEGNIALTLGRDIDRVITTLDLSLNAAASGMATPGLAAMDPQIRQSVLFDGAVVAEDFGGVFITDAAGHIIYSSHGPGPRAGDIGDKAFFGAQRDHADLGLVISPPLLSRSAGEWTIALSRRISRPDGSFGGIAVAALRLAYFQRLFSALDLGADAGINLRNTDGILLTRYPYVAAEIGRDLHASIISRSLARAPFGQFEAVGKRDGINRLFTYRQIGHLPLVLDIGVATREIYAEWTSKTLIIGSVMVLLAAAQLALTRRLRRELWRRMAAQEAARRAAAEFAALARELAAALAPLDALFRNSADTMLAVRIAPSGQFIYEAVNPAWQDITGISAERAIGRTPHDVLPAALADTIVTHWSAAQQQRRAVRFEFSTEFGLAKRDWEALAVPVSGEHGDIDRLIVVGRELTDRNRLAEQVRQVQKLQVVGQLAAGVAHDFNNILQAISSGVELLRGERFLSESGRQFLDVIGRASHRGAYLTHHLLSYARKQTLVPKPADVSEVLKDLRGTLDRTLGPGITLTIEVAQPVGRVSIDRGQLETALMNLAINASHAMPSGGALHFQARSAAAERFGELRPGRHVVIAVTDTGTGITPEVLARMFDPFFTTKGLAGTGLGLAMVQGFCRQSGGDVRAISTPPNGACFEVWLPELPPAALRPGAAEYDEGAGRAARVLLVDDAADVLILLDAFLRAGGCTVRQAAGGAAALAALAAGERFDVLVTDYMMPDINGLELITRARRIQPVLPAIVISGFTETADMLNDLPDAVLLHKPFSRDQLAGQIAALLSATARRPVAARAVQYRQA
jgi:PAS domain S-box-containing protein